MRASDSSAPFYPRVVASCDVGAPVVDAPELHEEPGKKWLLSLSDRHALLAAHSTLTYVQRSVERSSAWIN